MTFVTEHRALFGVELVLRVLEIRSPPSTAGWRSSAIPASVTVTIRR
jgi:hypothetical protein